MSIIRLMTKDIQEKIYHFRGIMNSNKSLVGLDIRSAEELKRFVEEEGYSVRALGKGGVTSLMSFVGKGRDKGYKAIESVVEALLLIDKNVYKSVDIDGKTALDYASSFGNGKVLRSVYKKVGIPVNEIRVLDSNGMRLFSIDVSGNGRGGKIVSSLGKTVMRFDSTSIYVEDIFGLYAGRKLIGMSTGVSLTNRDSNRYEVVQHYPSYKNDLYIEVLPSKWVLKNKRYSRIVLTVNNDGRIESIDNKIANVKRSHKTNVGRVVGTISPLVVLSVYVWVYGWSTFK